MKTSILNIIILLFLLKIFTCSIKTNETEFFEVHTNKTEYMLFDLVENKNKFNFINFQIILCSNMGKNSHISIINNDNVEIYVSDVIESNHFILNISEQINKSLKINATSSSMYIKYQYIKEDQDLLFPNGRIRNYSFTNNSISFEVSPIINNTNTTYDLYYLGKIDLYSNICKKLVYVLENKPIQSVSIKGINYFNLTFENITFKTGLYLIKGDNINDISYTYFYHNIRVVRKLGPYKTSEKTFFNVSTESDEYYSLFLLSNNTELKTFLTVQIILCDPVFKNEKQKSHIIIFGDNNFEIFNTDIIASRQFSVDLFSSTNISILATSSLMYIQYQFTNISYHINPFGMINSFDFNYTYHYLYFNITPVIINSTSSYELYFDNKTYINNECDKLVYSFNNKPISTLNITGRVFNDLNFTFDLISDDKTNFSGFVFLKSNYVNDTNYVYFYKTVNITNNYTVKPFNYLLFILIIVGICIIIGIIIYCATKKVGCSKPMKNDDCIIAFNNPEEEKIVFE